MNVLEIEDKFKKTIWGGLDFGVPHFITGTDSSGGFNPKTTPKYAHGHIHL